MQKTSDFSKFMVRPYGQSGRVAETVRTFCGQLMGEGESIFCDFVRMSFINGPLYIFLQNVLS